MLKNLLMVMLAMPIIAIIISLIFKHQRICELSNLVASIVSLLVVLPLPFLSLQGPFYFFSDYIILDSLNAWVLVCVGIVYFLSSIYAVGYMRMLHDGGPLNYFYALFSAFALVMFLAPLMNNIAVYWIMIELTTLVSTFLVSYFQYPESIEAAWKYIVIVSGGISLALLGIVLLYWGGTFVLGPTYSLSWSSLKEIVPHIHPVLLTLAFLLVLVGFGTKVGLAPMHTWLPDAHSEGPAPVSAMLSGALLNVAMLGIVRFTMILNNTSISNLVNVSLIVLGLFSLIIAALFIIRQKDIKRLMAYSSVEHMGVLALGFGFGGPLGIAGALYHMLNHSLNKCLMFFGAGNAMHLCGTKEINSMRNILKKVPFSGGIWLAGAIAITGSPPFALFLSEITVLRAGMNASRIVPVLILAVILIVIFCGFLNHFWKMYFEKTENIESHQLKISQWCTIPMVLAIIPLLILGIWWPQSIWDYFMQIGMQLGINP